MAGIFTRWAIGGLVLENRLVRSATWEGTAEADGAPSDRTIEIYADLAEGGVGLAITGYCYVRPEGLGAPRQTGVDDDARVEPLARVASAAHAAGGRIAMQIAHAGGSTSPGWVPGREVVYGPSAMHDPVFDCQVQELSRPHIQDIVEDFGRAAGRARRAGFDAVQLHGAHGYLISQFLSPERNRRRDRYGGSLANRARFVHEVMEAVRGAVGREYPLFIKLNGDDCTERGLQPGEAVQVARSLFEAGIDAIEVSGGVPVAGSRGPIRRVKGEEQEGYFLAEARAIREAVGCPVISVGGWRSRGRIEQALESVDAVALSRPLVRQPDLPRLFRRGETARADCVSCRGCQALAFDSGLACRKLLRERAAQGEST